MSLLDRFEREYQQYHGMTAHRAERQLRELRRLADFAGKQGPEECDANDLRSYLAHLVSQDLHVNTVRKRGNYLRPFFSWCYEVGSISGEQLMALRAVKNPNGATGRSTPKPYTTKELRRFWKELDERFPFADEKWLTRWRRGASRYKRVWTTAMRLQTEAIVALALDCGLRQTEIFTLDIPDMHYDNAYVVVRVRNERTNGNGKDHFREVPFTEEARTAVKNWLEFRTELKPKHDRPWLSLWPNQPEPNHLNAMSPLAMKDHMSKIGDWKLHRFRHTCATNWLRAGMPLEVVSRLLGHANIKQTLAYAAIVSDDIERQVQRNEAVFKQMTGRTT